MITQTHLFHYGLLLALGKHSSAANSMKSCLQTTSVNNPVLQCGESSFSCCCFFPFTLQFCISTSPCILHFIKDCFPSICSVSLIIGVAELKLPWKPHDLAFSDGILCISVSLVAFSLYSSWCSQACNNISHAGKIRLFLTKLLAFTEQISEIIGFS